MIDVAAGKVTARVFPGGDDWTLLLSADRDWLTDPDRVYPVTVDPTIHDPLKPNVAMAGLFERNLARIDFPVDPDDGQAGFGSTDAGNVSHAVPTIHPYIRTAPDGVPGHSREYAEHNATPRLSCAEAFRSSRLTAVRSCVSASA